MSVFLSILAVIGKILLVILCIVLVLLLLILLVPVRYDAQGSKENDDYDLHIRITWLLHLISLKAFMKKSGENADKGLDFRIAGISPKERKEKRAAKKKANRRDQKKKKLIRLKEEDPQKYAQLKEEARARKEAKEKAAQAEMSAADANDGGTEAIDAGRSGRTAAEESYRPHRDKAGSFAAPCADERSASPEGNAASVTPDGQVHFPEEEGTSAKKAGRRRRKRRGMAGKVISLYNKMLAFLTQLPTRIPEWISDFSAKVQGIYDTIIKWTDFLGDPRLTASVAILWKDLIKILRHASPRGMTGNLHFGFEDPSTTGAVYGLFTAVQSRIGPEFELYPNFDDKEFSGEADARGRIVLGYVAVILVGALLNKKIRYTIAFFKGRKGEKNGGE